MTFEEARTLIKKFEYFEYPNHVRLLIPDEEITVLAYEMALQEGRFNDIDDCEEKRKILDEYEPKAKEQIHNQFMEAYYTVQQESKNHLSYINK